MKNLFRVTTRLIGEITKCGRNHVHFKTYSSAAQQTQQRLQILSNEELSFFRRNGYIALENLFTPNEKKNMVNYCREIEEWPEIPGKYFKYHEVINGERKLTRVEDYMPYHHDLRELINSKVTKAVEDIVEEPVCTFKNKINFKFAGGVGYRPHQDEPSYDMFKQKMHVSALITADPMTIENGCLEMLPGEWPEEDGFLKMDANGDIHPDVCKTFEGKWVPIVTGPGAVILFSSLIPHKSERNNTDKPRRAFYITWNGISRGNKASDFYNLRREMVPQDIERDPSKDYSEGIKLFSEHIIEIGKGNMK